MRGAPSDLGPLARAQCFLFDLDGTLVDSSEAHDRAFRAALARVSEQAARAFVYAPHKGKKTRDTFRDVGIVGEAQLEVLVAHKQQAYREAVAAGGVVLLPGARELLAAVDGASRRSLLVTGASRRSTGEVLDRLGIARFFGGVVTADDVSHGKPHPEPYASALARFGVSADEAVAIEDGQSGVRSAAAAGLRVVGVHDDGLQGVDWLFGSLEELRSELAPHLSVSGR